MNQATGEETEDLRKALQLAVCKIIFDEDHEQGTRTTHGAISALTELTYQYATKSLIPDLYTFSTHANRKSTISPDDVAVALRKLQPDQLKAFKRKFCRSKNSTATIQKENDDNGKRISTAGGRRRKRNETEVLSLSSSSCSSDAEECVDDNGIDRKQRRTSRMPNTSRSNATSLPTKTSSTAVKKSTQRESLLNKFKLQSDLNNCTDNKATFDYYTLSTDEEDTIRSPSKDLGATKTTKSTLNAAKAATSKKFSLQRLQEKGRFTSTSNNKNDTLLDNGDDSTDDDDSFLAENASMAKKINRGTPKQSQVEEALANLSSDSGMDEDNSEEEDEIRVGAGKSTSSCRRRPVIESDGDD